VSQADLCRDIHGNLFTNGSEVIERWKPYDGGERIDLGEARSDDRFPAPDIREVQAEIDRPPVRMSCRVSCSNTEERHCRERCTGSLP